MVTLPPLASLVTSQHFTKKITACRYLGKKKNHANWAGFGEMSTASFSFFPIIALLHSDCRIWVSFVFWCSNFPSATVAKADPYRGPSMTVELPLQGIPVWLFLSETDQERAFKPLPWVRLLIVHALRFLQYFMVRLYLVFCCLVCYSRIFFVIVLLLMILTLWTALFWSVDNRWNTIMLDKLNKMRKRAYRSEFSKILVFKQTSVNTSAR